MIDFKWPSEMRSPEPVVNRRSTESVPHRRFRPLVRGARLISASPHGLLGMLVLVIAVERTIFVHRGELHDPVTSGWAFSAEAARDAAVRRDVLFLGDSLVKHGLLPRAFDDVSGLHSWNLAAAAAPAPMTYFLLRRALRAGARPRAVVLDLKPSLLAGGPRFRTRQWQEILTRGETMELLRSAGGFDFAAEVAVGEVVPSVRTRHELRAGLLQMLRGEHMASADLNRALRQNWSANAGANVVATGLRFDGEVTEAQHADLLSDRFATHRVNADFARRTIRLAESYGVRTYLLIPPFSPRLLDRRERSGAESKYTAFGLGLQEQHPGLTVLDGRPSRYPASAFVDPIHLNQDGMLALSRDVASCLRDDLGVSSQDSTLKRWVVLPTYRKAEALSGPALEGVEESRERVEGLRSRDKGKGA